MTPDSRLNRHRSERIVANPEVAQFPITAVKRVSVPWRAAGRRRQGDAKPTDRVEDWPLSLKTTP